jgi:hypothetical protein
MIPGKASYTTDREDFNNFWLLDGVKIAFVGEFSLISTF